MALGAGTREILRLVISQGMRLVVIGLAVGVLAGYVIERLLTSQYFGKEAWQQQMAKQLYGVELTDPLTISAITLLLLLVALAACFLPARRAATVDPLVAIRHE